MANQYQTGRQLKDTKIRILGVIVAGEPGGMPIETWTPIHPGSLWAYVRQLSAKEYYAQAAIQAGEEMLFVINWRDDISSTGNMIKCKAGIMILSELIPLKDTSRKSRSIQMSGDQTNQLYYVGVLYKF